MPYKKCGSDHQNIPKYRKQEVSLYLKHDFTAYGFWLYEMKKTKAWMDCSSVICLQERYKVSLPSNSSNSLIDHIQLSSKICEVFHFRGYLDLEGHPISTSLLIHVRGPQCIFSSTDEQSKSKSKFWKTLLVSTMMILTPIHHSQSHALSLYQHATCRI